MISVTVDLPDSLHRRLTRLAEAQGETVAGLLARTAERCPDDQGLEILEQMAARAKPGGMAEIFAAVPDAEPLPFDRLVDPEPFDREKYDRMIGRTPAER